LRKPDLPKDDDGEPKGSNFICLELCVAIQNDYDYQSSISQSDANNWPKRGLDFEQVHKRILALKKTIWGLLANDIVLRSSIPWTSLTAQIMNAKYKTKVGNEVVQLPCGLNRFLAMPTIKRLQISSGTFGG
jgi:hypothetical protein